MMFKPYFGICLGCDDGKIKLIVTKKTLCKYHNEQLKNKKPIKPIKPNYGNCSCCGGRGLIVVKSGLRSQCNEKRKGGAKSNRIVKLVDKSEKKKSLKYLKKELDRVYSLYIRWTGAKEGKNKCFTCNTELPVKELQDGHYESRRYLALRYFDGNNHPQCFQCNIRLKGNYTVYALRMIEKYGKEHLDFLAIKKHNTVKWTAFEYELLIKEYSEKANILMEKNK